MITQSDLQHLLLMKKSIYNFEQQPPSLDSLLLLTHSLEELLDSLKSIDEKWKNKFRTEWWELEFTGAVMLECEAEDLTKEDRNEVAVALQNIKSMIEALVSD